ncbi:MAG: tetratricopeptide repeat protein, partial [Actinomycetota bacterium]
MVALLRWLTKLTQSLSYDYSAAGRFDEAIAHYENAVAGFEHTLGPDHLDTLDYRRGLAFLCQQAGRAHAAL